MRNMEAKQGDLDLKSHGTGSSEKLHEADVGESHTKISGIKTNLQLKSVSPEHDDLSPLDLAIAPIPPGRRTRQTKVEEETCPK